MNATAIKINIGLEDSKRIALCEALSKFLADTYSLYLKTQNYHWNVTGPLFASLHHLFEKQYKALAEATDEIAERIRALGERAPASFGEFVKLSSIPEDGATTHARAMVQSLLDGHESLIRTINVSLAPAERAKDAATIDLLARRLAYHEKAAWMLRSQLQE